MVSPADEIQRQVAQVRAALHQCSCSLEPFDTEIRRVLSLKAEGDYGFKPTSGVRTFGEILGHLANEHYMFCSEVKGEKNPQESVDFEKKTAKADVVKAITDSIAYCDSVYASLKDDPRLLQPYAGRRDNPYSTLLLNVTHDSEHYGNLVTYLRMKGIVPPSSKP